MQIQLGFTTTINNNNNNKIKGKKKYQNITGEWFVCSKKHVELVKITLFWHLPVNVHIRTLTLKYMDYLSYTVRNFIIRLLADFFQFSKNSNLSSNINSSLKYVLYLKENVGDCVFLA